MERTQHGLAPATDGWFAVNVRDAAWVTNDTFGAACIFEGDAGPFPQVGYTLAVLEPGQPNGLYHREQDQEDFLVLAGECLLIVEGEERRLRAWDFVHCPAGTAHIFVGAGEGPCTIFMAGARTHREQSPFYPRSEAALLREAGVETDTDQRARGLRPLPGLAPGAAGELRGPPLRLSARRRYVWAASDNRGDVPAAPRHRPPRHRRLLRLGRAAPPPRAARPAGDRRRLRAARGRDDGQLRGAALRRGLGDAGRAGARAVPRGGRDRTRLRGLPRAPAARSGRLCASGSR